MAGNASLKLCCPSTKCALQGTHHLHHHARGARGRQEALGKVAERGGASLGQVANQARGVAPACRAHTQAPVGGAGGAMRGIHLSLPGVSPLKGVQLAVQGVGRWRASQAYWRLKASRAWGSFMAAMHTGGLGSSLQSWARQACKPTWVDEGVNVLSVHAFNQPLQAVV